MLLDGTVRDLLRHTVLHITFAHLFTVAVKILNRNGEIYRTPSYQRIYELPLAGGNSCCYQFMITPSYLESYVKNGQYNPV